MTTPTGVPLLAPASDRDMRAAKQGRKIAALSLMLAAIVAANALTDSFGLVAVGGLTATAGTWVAGLAFVARDWLHEAGGRRWVAVALVMGTLLSAILSPTLALASAVAFSMSEVADWAIYAPLRHRSRIGAALASNTVGAVLDSILFLSIAGFPLSGAGTQAVVKVATTTAIVAALGVSRALLRQPLHAASGGRHA